LSAPIDIWIIGRHTQDNKCQMALPSYHSLPQVQAAFDVFLRAGERFKLKKGAN
jgi:hypothetical protein